MPSHKNKLVLIVLIAVLVIAGAGIYLNHGRKETASLDNWYCPTNWLNYSYSDNGIFRVVDNGIAYLDAASGKEVSICTKAGCTHGDETCPAYVEALYVTGIVYDGSRMYFVSSSGAQDLKSLNLTECDINGENRKKVADFSDIQTPTGVCYSGDNVIITYYNGFDLEKREMIENREAGIYVYNRKKKEGKKLYHSTAWENTIMSFEVIENEIYFVRIYNPLTEEEIMQQSEGEAEIKTELCRLSVDDGEVECIEGQVENGWMITRAGNTVLYTAADGLQAYDAKSGRVKTVWEGDEITVVASRLSDGKAVFRQYSEEDKLFTYYYCGENGVVEEIGESGCMLSAVYDSVCYASMNNAIGIVETKEWQRGNDTVKYEIAL